MQYMRSGGSVSNQSGRTLNRLERIARSPEKVFLFNTLIRGTKVILDHQNSTQNIESLFHTEAFRHSPLDREPNKILRALLTLTINLNLSVERRSNHRGRRKKKKKNISVVFEPKQQVPSPSIRSDGNRVQEKVSRSIVYTQIPQQAKKVLAIFFKREKKKKEEIL